MVAPATGRGAHFGSGGFRSTGQTGPAVAVPPIPVFGGAGSVADGLVQPAAARAIARPPTNVRIIERVVMAPGRYASPSGSEPLGDAGVATVAGAGLRGRRVPRRGPAMVERIEPFGKVRMARPTTCRFARSRSS